MGDGATSVTPLDKRVMPAQMSSCLGIGWQRTAGKHRALLASLLLPLTCHFIVGLQRLYGVVGGAPEAT